MIKSNGKLQKISGNLKFTKVLAKKRKAAEEKIKKKFKIVNTAKSLIKKMLQKVYLILKTHIIN